MIENVLWVLRVVQGRALSNTVARGDIGSSNAKKNIKIYILDKSASVICSNEGLSENDTQVSSANHDVGKYCKESLQIGKCMSTAVGTQNIHDKGSELAENSSYISPYDRSKSRITKWKRAGANRYMLSLIDEGYNIPFKNLPDNFDTTTTNPQGMIQILT